MARILAPTLEGLPTPQDMSRTPNRLEGEERGDDNYYDSDSHFPPFLTSLSPSPLPSDMLTVLASSNNSYTTEEQLAHPALVAMVTEV